MFRNLTLNVPLRDIAFHRQGMAPTQVWAGQGKSDTHANQGDFRMLLLKHPDAAGNIREEIVRELRKMSFTEPSPLINDLSIGSFKKPSRIPGHINMIVRFPDTHEQYPHAWESLLAATHSFSTSNQSCTGSPYRKQGFHCFPFPTASESARGCITVANSAFLFAGMRCDVQTPGQSRTLHPRHLLHEKNCVRVSP